MVGMRRGGGRKTPRFVSSAPVSWVISAVDLLRSSTVAFAPKQRNGPGRTNAGGGQAVICGKGRSGVQGCVNATRGQRR